MRTLSNSCRRKLWFNKLNYFSFNADGKTSKSGTLSTSQYQFCLAGSITLLNSSNLFRQIQFSFLVYLSVAVLLEQFANDVMTVPFLSSCETWRISVFFIWNYTIIEPCDDPRRPWSQKLLVWLLFSTVHVVLLVSQLLFMLGNTK